MVPEVTILNEKTAELTLTAACPTCGGDLKLRVSPDGARTYCPACRVIARTRVGFGPDGLVVAPDSLAQA
ncbi:MAG: hypothetical protein AB1938_26415 [Myxococcota bacterium]